LWLGICIICAKVGVLLVFLRVSILVVAVIVAVSYLDREFFIIIKISGYIYIEEIILGSSGLEKFKSLIFANISVSETGISFWIVGTLAIGYLGKTGVDSKWAVVTIVAIIGRMW
jgi:hypothetical protein